jgi:hypothetical protein
MTYESIKVENQVLRGKDIPLCQANAEYGEIAIPCHVYGGPGVLRRNPLVRYAGTWHG